MAQTTENKSPNKPKTFNFGVAGVGVLIGLGLVAAGSAAWHRLSAGSAPVEDVALPAASSVPLAAAPVAQSEPVPVPVDPAVLRIEAAQKLIEESSARYSRLRGYQATFDTSELDDKGEWVGETSLFRFESPFTIFMTWFKGEQKGMQILYAQDKFDDQMFVRMPGMLFNFIPPIAVSPDDPRAKRKHSIRSAGIGHFLTEFSDSFRAARTAGKLQVTSVEDVTVEGEEGTLVDVDYGMPYDYPRTSVAFSKRTGLPLEVKLYKNRIDLVESYRYLKLVENPAPDDAEFTTVADKRMVEKYLEAIKS